MLLRGLRRRCPWCGGKGFFTGFATKQDTCATCGLHWRRGDVGYELGAAAVTAIITFGPLMLVLGAMVAITWPDIEVAPMFVVLVVLALVLPVVMYGPSYTVWQAIDIVMRPPQPADFDAPSSPVPADGSSSSADRSR